MNLEYGIKHYIQVIEKEKINNLIIPKQKVKDLFNNIKYFKTIVNIKSNMRKNELLEISNNLYNYISYNTSDNNFNI